MKKLLSTFVLSLTMILLLTSCDLFSGNIGDAIVNFHSYGEWTVTAKPTCSKDGEKVRYCSCGDKETAIIPALAHTPGKAAIEDRVEPTYGLDGSYNEVVRCSVCNEKLSETHHVIPKPKHTPGDAVKENVLEATCYREGSYDIVTYCSECNQELERISHILPMTEHIPALAVEENRVEPTHENDGSYQMVVYCSVAECHKELERTTHTLDMLVHHPGDVVIENVIEATCTKNGSYDEAVYCLDKDCGHKELSRKTVITDIIPHTNKAAVEENRSDATCYSEGKYDSVVYCAVCTTELSRTTVTLEKTAHSPAPAVIENKVNATCTTDGSYDEVVYCSVENCKAQISKTAIILTSTGHTEAIDEPVAPTCTATGLTEGKHCSVCNVILVAQDTVAALGHTEVIDNAITPTCTETGLTQGKHCSVCGEVLVAQQTIDALEHNYVDKICTVCGDKYYSKGLEYTQNSDGTCYVSGIGTCTDTDIVIPKISPDGWMVVRIGNEAFYNCSSLTSIVIPNSVTSISNSAFGYCSSIVSIIIPDSVTTIGELAFHYCTSLKSITIGERVTSVGSSVFFGCTNVTEINFNAIAMEDIPYDYGIFSRVGTSGSGITVNIGSNVTRIPSFLFYSSKSYYVSPKINVLNFKENSVCSYIGRYAFNKCIELTEFSPPDSLTEIGGDAFSRCTALKNVTIPINVSCIGFRAFAYCTSLIEFNLNALDLNIESMNDYILYESGDSIIGITVNIGSSTSKIPHGLFTSAENVAYVNFAEGSQCLLIEDYAFNGCDKLVSIIIPDSVETISYSAFGYCDSLTSVTLGKEIKTIGNYAFSGCSNLSNITIFNNIKTIEQRAFSTCYNLIDVYYAGTVNEWNNISISSGNQYLNDATLYYYSKTNPKTEGNFWHYDENGEIAIWPAYVAPNYSVGLEYISNGDGTCSLTEIGTCTDTDIVIP